MNKDKRYTHEETLKQCLKGDIYSGEGFRIGRGNIPRIYIANPEVLLCSITRNKGKGRLVEHLLSHIGEPIDLESLTSVSNLKCSTVRDYMIALSHAFENSQWYKLVYDSHTKKYTLVERTRDKIQDSVGAQDDASFIPHRYTFDI